MGKAMPWTVEETEKVVSTVRIKAKRKKDWEQYVLIRSDGHFDNPLSNLKLQRRHLDQAIDRNAPVIDLGDFFCAMQGKKDRRHEKGSVKEENQVNAYYDSLVDDGEKLLLPYKNILAVFGKGNHETAILKHNETDLTERLVNRLRRQGSQIQLGGYRGWIRFLLEDKYRQSFLTYYTHGAGGNAPVTKGVINTNRRAAYIDADIIVSGHIHEAWCMELCRVGLTNNGNEMVHDQIHLSVPTYKEEFTALNEGFHHEKEGPPKPLGAWWLRFFWDTSEERFKFDYVRAK